MNKYLITILILCSSFVTANTVTNNPFVDIDSINQSQNFSDSSDTNIEEKTYLGLEDISITGVIMSDKKKLLLIQYANGSSAILSLNDQINNNLKVHQIYLESAEFSHVNSPMVLTLDFLGNIQDISEDLEDE